ncbi:MAG: diguanylate cyclase [Betaproteobacteria bacterium]|nr:diguanylate cyclase [Betaproteobacteria bacterium]
MTEKKTLTTAEKLFVYLRDVLYYPNRAQLDCASLPEDFQEFGQGFVYFAEMLKEARTLATALSRGDLSSPLPKPDNELASNLKSLHATLKHLTWQTRQVANGDHKQRVRFMGDFSEAFNEMVVQLKERQDALLGEIETIQRQQRDLERSNNLFEIITSRLSEWIVVVDRNTGERFFTNHPVEKLLNNASFEPRLYDILLSHIQHYDENDDKKFEEFSLADDGVVQWFLATFYPLRWYGRDAVAAVLADITANKIEIDKLEGVAYRDALTGVYSRHYGMKRLNEWIDQQVQFVVCFIDMDRLKYVNDVFGHAEGDRYILQVSKLLHTFSEGCCLCRLGGDEFMILAGGIDQKAAEEKLETLRNTLVAEVLTTESGKSFNGSMSFGVVEVKADNTLLAGDILSQADEKMYFYKKAHRMERCGTLG